MGTVRVGTSSWADPGFVEEWYPEGLPARDRLPYYAERFEAVEVNSTFYAVPGTSTVERWVAVTPPSFTFDVKLHRLLSRHSAGLEALPADLRDGVAVAGRGRVVLDDRLEGELVERTLLAVEPLIVAGKLATFLAQLSPGFGPRDHSLDELSSLVARLDPHPLAVELRNRSWVTPERLESTLGWFSDHGVVWVSVDAPQADHWTIMPPVDAVTRDGYAYLRAHGRNADGYVRGRSVADRFGYRYSDEELREITGRAAALAEQAGEIGSARLMFNNNRGSDAPVAAERARVLLGRSAEPD